MATLRVHEDQENRFPELMQKQMNAINQKRTVLGCLDNQPARQLKGKQPLTVANGKKDENACTKNEYKKSLVPIVPVAQFEAFKVYEDEEQQLKQAHRPRKLKENDLSNFYKGTSEDRFVTKKQLLQMGKIQLQNDLPTLKIEEVDEIPSMSIEKVDDEVSKPRISRNMFELEEFWEYQTDIYQYLREHELFNRPKAGYMKKQPDITHNMRTILVDWLVEVAEEYKLHTETLYLAVNFIDRFLSYMSVVRAKLQLVGTAAMFAAAKYEEIYPPDVSEFVYITDDTYNKRQVIRMEHLILKVLSFDLSIPTPLTFITAMCTINKLPDKTMFLAMYLCELSLLEAEPYLEMLPSNLAAGAIALARHTLGEEAWTEDLANKTGYDLAQLQKSVEFLNVMFLRAPNMPQQAIQEKYKKVKYLHVSNLGAPETCVQFD